MDTPEEARVEERSSHFTRELGRAVTFLSRSRKRFMNERLRDYGFSGAIKKLEALGYLYRETNQNDRRQNNLYLTEKGRELVPIIRSYMGRPAHQNDRPGQEIIPAKKGLPLQYGGPFRVFFYI